MSALSVIQKQAVANYSATDYADSFVDEFLTTMAGSFDEYNPQCWSSSEALAAGADQYLFGGTDFWFPSDGEGGYVTDAVDAAAVQAKIDQHGDGDPWLMLDIELWNIKTETAEAIANLRAGAVPWREQTNRTLGFYRMVPYSDYTLGQGLKAAVDASDAQAEAKWRGLINSWMRLNDANYAALSDVIDIFIPRCYVPDTWTLDDWKWGAGLQIAEAIRIANGKPVYPIVWSSFAPAGAFLTEAQWIDVLQFVSAFPGIGGTVIWSGGDDPTEYTFTDAVANLVTGQADFAPPTP